MASAAIYSPAGQPSVRCRRSRTLASSASTPAPFSKESASRGPIDRSSAVTSVSRLERATAPSAEVPRCATPAPSCQPGGRRRANSAIVFRHCLFVTASAWSSSTVTGDCTEATADTNLGTTVMSAPAEASAENIDGSTRPIRSSATARALSSTTGSLSPSSQDSHAARDPIRSAHCDMRVVLP